MNHTHLEVVDKDDHAGAAERGAQTDVVHAAVDAQGDAPAFVDDVVANAVVSVVAAVTGRRFGSPVIGDGGGTPLRQRAVRPFVVVVGNEALEQCLQFGDRGRLIGLGGEPALECLLEPLDFPAGGRVVGPGVLLRDAEAAKLRLEGVASPLAAGQARGEDHAVVGQRRRGNSVLGHGGAELSQHDRPADALVRAEPQGVAGVIVEPAQDLDVDAGREAVVGEVGLPGLIRLLGLEAHVGGAGPLVGLWCDEPGAVQIAPDGRGRQ